MHFVGDFILSFNIENCTNNASILTYIVMQSVSLLMSIVSLNDVN